MNSIYRLRVQVIVTADDDGENAPLFSANSMLNRLPTLNAVFTPAAVEFVFDAVQDFQKFNSTLLNRDFTPLERPNVGSDKWDHEPQVDSKRHSRARDALCDLYPNKLVLIVRERKELDKDANGHWGIVGKSGSSSGANARYVNLSAFSEATDLAHEIGHYLQLPHTFSNGVANVADAAAKIKKYVEDGHPRADGLQALDGDRAVIGDTPADCKGSIFESKGLDKCGPVGTIDIPVDFGDTVRTYHLTPDRNMVMSYFKGCTATGAKTISPQQARRVRDALELRHRHVLISPALSPANTIARMGTAAGGTILDVDVALVRAGRIVTAVRDSNGKVKVIAWDINGANGALTRRGEALGGNINHVRVCGIGANMVATAVVTPTSLMKVILWEVRENGDVIRRGDAQLDGQVTDVACCTALYQLSKDHMATATRRIDGTLAVDVWRTYIDGTIVHRATAVAGKVNGWRTELNTPRLAITNAAEGALVTYVRDDNLDFKAILWNFDGDALTRVNSQEIEGARVGRIAACNVTPEVTVAAIEDKDRNLKLLAYGLPERGAVIQARSDAAAGDIADVAICRVGTEMVVTAVRGSSNTLKMILWQVTPTGDALRRMDDAATSDGYSMLSMCHTDRSQLVTAMRDAEGKLKLFTWRVYSPVSSTSEFDEFRRQFIGARMLTQRDAALGSECVSVED